MITVELKQDNQSIGILTAAEKLFKTGSRRLFWDGQDPDRRETLPGPGPVGRDWLQAQTRSAQRLISLCLLLRRKVA